VGPLLIVVVLLAGCAPVQTGSPASTSPVASPSVSRTVPTSGSTGPMTAPSGIPATQWAALLADLATRGAPIDGLEVVSARAATWPDTALGCPKPGTMYAQHVVEGYQVVVRAGGRTYDYRFGGTPSPRLCEP
jgi:hypothetical protein